MEIATKIINIFEENGIIVLGCIFALAISIIGTTGLRKIFGKVIKNKFGIKIYSLLKFILSCVLCSLTIIPFFIYKNDLRIIIYIINVLFSIITTVFFYVFLKFLDNIFQSINPKWKFIEILLKELDEEKK